MRLPRAPQNLSRGKYSVSTHYTHCFLVRKQVFYTHIAREFGFGEAQMVRIASRVEDEEAADCYSPIEGVRLDQKVDASRSKHSETEQRRRSKINERFQILRDLVPENDQKRDKASLLLEVIQYIQFLQEKLQMYEGSYQGWSPEPTKLAPWKINYGPVESFLDQTQLERHISGHEDNGVLNPLRHVRTSVESELIGSSLYKSTDNLPIATNQPLLLNLPTQAATFEGMSGRSHRECFPDAEQLTQLSQSQSWPGRSCVNDYSFPICNTNENEPNIESGEASYSSTCSQLILSSLKNALQSSGVNLSQASISVQLDVGKQINDRSTMAKFKMKDNQSPSGLVSVAPGNEHPHKKFRVDES
ncbi:transcription factor BIM3-like isoform X2 [Primulina huaijiensis]|uniref:transcription factor BIM3-like isoform X2 n=1 Tax=Primulina huaijiensis TaxID=1492673 RepID=UPI003CC6F1B2